MVDDEEFVAVADETSILLVNWINKEERDLDDDGSHDSRRSHNRAAASSPKAWTPVSVQLILYLGKVVRGATFRLTDVEAWVDGGRNALDIIIS